MNKGKNIKRSIIALLFIIACLGIFCFTACDNNNNNKNGDGSTTVNYTITYNLDGGTNSANNPATFTLNDLNLSLSAPTKDGYCFMGWYTDGEYSESIAQITENINYTVYAKFVKADEVLNLEKTTDTDGNKFYKVNGFAENYSGCKILGIPAVHNNLPVKGIAASAFDGNEVLTSVIIPASVTTIGEKAFANCTSITEVVIPASVKYIGEHAFTNIVVYENDLDKYTRTDMTIFVAPEVNAEAWEYNWNFGSTAVWNYAGKYGEADNFTWALTTDGIAITNYIGTDSAIVIPEKINNIAVTTIAEFAFTSAEFSSVTIPSSVTTICDFAFAVNENLTTITIPSTVITVGDYTFYYCDGLTSAVISEGVKTIGEGVFQSCSKLESVTIPSTIKTLPKCTFCGCVQLTSIEISEGVEEIGEGAFIYCYSLITLTLPSTVKKIDMCAFDYCYVLTSITIPADIEYVGERAFNACDNVAVYVMGSKSLADNWDENWNAFENYDGEEDYTYDNLFVVWDCDVKMRELGDYVYIINDLFGNAIIVKYIGTDTEVTIPKSVTVNNEEYKVTTILAGAFADCKNLTAVVIPENISSIQQYAFIGCDNLTIYVEPNEVLEYGDNHYWTINNVTYSEEENIYYSENAVVVWNYDGERVTTDNG